MRQLPLNISSKIDQNLQTIGNDADPKMQVLVSRAKNTVEDGSYWAVETIREIEGLGAVSVAPRRFDYKGPPNRIYEIHIRNGIIYTSIREYPDKLKSGFVTQFSLGTGKSVGIAFNGEWKKYRKMYRLVTEEKPWVTWVDTDGILWAQKWDELIFINGYFEEVPPITEVTTVEKWDGTFRSNTSVNSSGQLTSFNGCRTTNKIIIEAGVSYSFDNGLNGNYGRLRWENESGGLVLAQDLGADGGVTIAPTGATGVYFFYAWDTAPTPSVSAIETVEIPQDPIWREGSLSAVKLSDNVSKVKMIRAWKNLVIHDKDQGLVVAYIKTNGKVYYRNYCIQSDYTETWEFEKELTAFTGTAVNVNLFITNDYRMGFIIEDNTGKIHWLVTYRNWGGMASPADNITIGLKDLRVEVFPVAYREGEETENITTSVNINHLYVCPAGITPTITGTERLSLVDKKTIKIKFNYTLECDINNLKNALILQNTVGQAFTINQVAEQDNILTITTIEDMPFSQNVILKYNVVGLYYLAFRISETCVYDYGNTIDLVLAGVPPTGFVNENISFNFINPIVSVTQVYYRNRYVTENLTTNIQNINIVVTKVGDKPL